MRRKVLFGMIGLLVIYFIFANSLLAPEEIIRKQLLKSTPIGTKMGDVIAYEESKKEWKLTKWEIDEVAYDHGYDDEDYRTIG